MNATRAAAVGFKAHTGWAVAVALAGPPGAPEVLVKRRLELAAGFEEAGAFHACRGKPLDEARAMLGDAEARFGAAARTAIAGLLADVAAAGCSPAVAAIVGGRDAPMPPLEAILRSHARVHAAEGELFRRVLAGASRACRLPAARIPAAELAGRCASALGLDEAALRARLAALGKASGRPWTQDHREAALAAWAALAGAGQPG